VCKLPSWMLLYFFELSLKRFNLLFEFWYLLLLQIAFTLEILSCSLKWGILIFKAFFLPDSILFIISDWGLTAIQRFIEVSIQIYLWHFIRGWVTQYLDNTSSLKTRFFNGRFPFCCLDIEITLVCRNSQRIVFGAHESRLIDCTFLVHLKGRRAIWGSQV
jgi:hypothetical protein